MGVPINIQTAIGAISLMSVQLSVLALFEHRHHIVLPMNSILRLKTRYRVLYLLTNAIFLIFGVLFIISQAPADQDAAKLEVIIPMLFLCVPIAAGALVFSEKIPMQAMAPLLVIVISIHGGVSSTFTILSNKPAIGTRCISVKNASVVQGAHFVPLGRPLKVGDVILLNGIAKSTAKTAVVSLLEKLPTKSNPIVYVSLYIKAYLKLGIVAFTTFEKRGWWREEGRKTDLKNGSEFKIKIRVLETAYEIYINENLVWTYNYRWPSFDSVKAIGIANIEFNNPIECPAETGEPKEEDSQIVVIRNGIFKTIYGHVLQNDDLAHEGKKKVGPSTKKSIVIEY
ncbi:unnamed protein product [Caenorhabditis auriculariae]|uniref:Galectin n=1 Tax=Caenorhabditis auriculariae TaxID=2777116 RepID=A0A8S1H004_9PELO|nr:unnamed protein product [Caenorhabditis auriculariae]